MSEAVLDAVNTFLQDALERGLRLERRAFPCVAKRINKTHQRGICEQIAAPA